MVDLPPGKSVVGSKWVYKIKTNSEGSYLKEIHTLKLHLSSCFEMKDLGLLRFFLGIEAGKSSSGYFISQVKYATDILQRAVLTDSKIVDTPLELNVKLNCYEGQALSNPTLYRHLVRSLNYLTITRPNICHAVHVVSQFISSPRSKHFAVVLRILHYIKVRKKTVVSRSSAEAEYRAFVHTTSEIV
ncbi:uncharacterized protein LOC113290997 [Papaver somniferum]|uniref:uncharacterized protein LOC113290997 n=1 Tax=Papaver somniferum TaxID=3469 RepID=UPI000E700817|nr:uncharacterized protein LOC113290997 [Papaver somniferum]